MATYSEWERQYEKGDGREYRQGGRWPANCVLSHIPPDENGEGGCERVGERRVKGSDRPNREGAANLGDGGWIGKTSKVMHSAARHADPDGLETVEAWRCATDEHGNNLCPVAELDRQSGELKSGQLLTHHKRAGESQLGTFNIRDRTGEPCNFGGDSGGASRFFYTAKASRAERNAGLEGFEERGAHAGGRVDGEGGMGTWDRKSQNHHPTVKPVDLMRWLCRLVTPPGGTILDPFAGSGTTGIAAVLEGFDFIGIEREHDYCEISKARIAWWDTHKDRAEEILALSSKSERERAEHEAAGQMGLDVA